MTSTPSFELLAREGAEDLARLEVMTPEERELAEIAGLLRRFSERRFPDSPTPGIHQRTGLGAKLAITEASK